LQSGLSTVAGWVIGGKRIVTAQDVHDAIDRLGLRRADPSAILSVQALDRDPHSAEATAALDWIDMFDGDTPWTRIQPRDPNSWNEMDQGLTEAADTLESQGWHSTLVRGSMRQATFFRVGTALPAVRQHILRYRQGGHRGTADPPRATPSGERPRRRARCRGQPHQRRTRLPPIHVGTGRAPSHDHPGRRCGRPSDHEPRPGRHVRPNDSRPGAPRSRATSRRPEHPPLPRRTRRSTNTLALATDTCPPLLFKCKKRSGPFGGGEGALQHPLHPEG
jgi:hypothetical protein